MKFFNLNIEHIFIIDAYSSNERKEGATTTNLRRVLEKYLPPVSIDVLWASTNQEITNYLSNIESAKHIEGMMIFFNGHGDTDGSFGNKETNGILINWSQIEAVLEQINLNCSQQLIINTTCTCHSFVITELENNHHGFAKCVIGMQAGNFASPASAEHNDILFYRGQSKYFNLDDSIKFLNEMLMDEENSKHPKEYASKIY